jgi:hypothetical protein
MKYYLFSLAIFILYGKALSQDCECALSLSSTPPQSPNCSYGIISAAGETCHWDSYSVEFIIRNIETGEFLAGPYFGGVGGSNNTNLNGNQMSPILQLGNGKWEIKAKIVKGSCTGREKTIIVDFSKREICDGLDNDCIGGIDNGLTVRKYYKDVDHDGYGNRTLFLIRCGPEGQFTTEDSTDCNDNNNNINPGLLEICGDGIDNNCDGRIDENKKFYYLDRDGDGYGSSENKPCPPKNIAAIDVNLKLAFVLKCEKPAGYSEFNNDCDDCNRKIHPKQKEICDRIDNNCDGFNNEGLSTKWYPDSDKDSYGDANSVPLVVSCNRTPPKWYVQNHDDFNDNCKSCYPNAPEICGDGIDNDNNTKTTDLKKGYFDNDGDGHYSKMKNEGCGFFLLIPGDDCDDDNKFIYRECNIDTTINIRFSSFIPSPAVLLYAPTVGVDDPIVLMSGFKGDNRGFSYEGSHRFMINADININTEVQQLKIVNANPYNFGETFRYAISECFRVEGKPFWWGGLYNENNFEARAIVERTEDNLKISINNARSLFSPSNYIGKITLMANAGDPLISPELSVAPINVDVAIDVFWEKEKNRIRFDVTANYDGFPCHELYINKTLVLFHDPLISGDSVFSLIGEDEHPPKFSYYLNF